MVIQADNNVPFTGARKRYSVLGHSPTWVYQKMAAGVAMNGAAPRTASVTAENLDPTVTAGRAEYVNLTEGGYFAILGGSKQPIQVEAVDNQAGATITLVSKDGSTSRAMPTSQTFVVAAGEYLRATAGSQGGRVGFLVRLAG